MKLDNNQEQKELFDGFKVIACIGAYCMVINKLFRYSLLLFLIGIVGVLYGIPSYGLFCCAAMGMLSYGYQEKIFSEYCISVTIDDLSRASQTEPSMENYINNLTAYGACLYSGVYQTLMVNNIVAVLGKVRDQYPDNYDQLANVMNDRLTGLIKWHNRQYTCIGVAFIISIVSSLILGFYFLLQWNILSIVFFASFVELFTKTRYFIGVFLGELVYIDYLGDSSRYNDILDKHVETFTGGYYEKDVN